jgi:hypothetical protein
VAENAEWKKLLETYNFLPEIVWGSKLREQLIEGRTSFGKILPSLNIKP